MTGLDRDLGRLCEIVPHLRGSTVTAGDGWTSGRTFLGHDPTDPLDVLMAEDRTGRFAVDRPSYASAFYEGYAIRLLGTAIGCGRWVETCPTRRRSTHRSGWRSTFPPRSPSPESRATCSTSSWTSS